MKKTISLISVSQPIGVFYLGKIQTKDLLSTYYVQNRNLDSEGIQRDLNVYRASKIAKYLDDPDAIFPTSIVLSAKSKDVKISSHSNGQIELSFDNELRIFEVIDGQHRVSGLQMNSDTMEELPVVILFDLSQEDKAYIFSIINSTQKQVNKSYIYDLFEVYEERSPIKTCHNIVKTLNSDQNSPFYKRIKMLGKKEEKNESLSQGTFVTELCKLITSQDTVGNKYINDSEPNNPKLIFKELYDKEKDSIIYKIVFNYFKAVSSIFKSEWNHPDKYILSKTTGFGALCKALPIIYRSGLEKGDLSIEFFERAFIKTKKYLEEEKIDLIVEDLGLGGAGQNKLSKIITDSWNK